jgi:hypothetical protein
MATKNLRLCNQIKRNVSGSVYGRFSIIFSHFIPIGQNISQLTFEIQVPAWDKLKHVAELDRLMRSQPSPLNNYISNGNTYINKGEKKPGQIRFHSKRPHTITKRMAT